MKLDKRHKLRFPFIEINTGLSGLNCQCGKYKKYTKSIELTSNDPNFMREVIKL